MDKEISQLQFNKRSLLRTGRERKGSRMIFKYTGCLKKIKNAGKITFFLTPTCVFFLFVLFPFVLESEPKWRSGVIRIESDVSTGKKSFDEITREARKKGLDFITFTDQFNVKVEYGLRPFPHVFKIHKTRKSIKTYGIKKYLNQIRNLNEKYPDIALIPGADIAPFYYWDGSLLDGTLKCRRYSEQLTLIGSASPDFYKNLPVIHNETHIFNFNSFFKFLPLIPALLGIYMIIFRKSAMRPGEETASPRIAKQRLIVGIILTLIGIFWTLNNRPFTKKYPFNQYRNYGILPYTYLADYISSSPEKEKVAVFWSAPGALMKYKTFGIELLTEPYWRDVKEVDGFNGFAVIYGDALKAHLPGMEWDNMLLKYISGKRKSKPVTIGEIDYHGKKRRLDLIKTMVYTNDLTEKSIITALKRGNSYSYFQKGSLIMDLKDVYMYDPENTTKCIPGETISGITGKFRIKLSGTVKPYTTGPVIQPKKNGKVKPATVTVVVNGQAVASENISLESESFSIEIPVTITEKNSTSYVRLIIDSPSTGLIVINPFFCKL